MVKMKMTRKQRLLGICKEKCRNQDYNRKQVGLRVKQRNKVKKDIL